MKKLIILAAIIPIMVSSLVFADTDTEVPFKGDTEDALLLAKDLYNTYHEFGILAVEVTGKSMNLGITEKLYRELLKDNDRAKSIMLEFNFFLTIYISHVYKETGHSVMYLYLGDKKVMRTKVKNDKLIIKKL